MTNEEEICTGCERKVFCIDCKHKDVIIPEPPPKVTIEEMHRLSGLRYNPTDYVALSAG